MTIPLASTSHSLVSSSSDFGLFLLSALIAFMTLRYGIRIGRSSLHGELDYGTFLKLFALCLFGGLSAVGRFAYIFSEWGRASEIFGWDNQFPLYAATGGGVYWIYVVIAVSSFGVAVGFICLNFGEIEKSRLGGFLIRWRWPIGIVAAAVLIGLGAYRGVVKPMLNRNSLLKEFESTQGIDAYRNPKEVRLYRVYRENYYDYQYRYVSDKGEEAERLQLEKEAWEKVSDNYRGYRFEKTTELLDADDLKSKLDELYVYGSGSSGREQADYLIRFVGETSVLDLWLSDNSDIRIFTNKLMYDVPDSLSFSRPYQDIMQQSVGVGLKYHAFGEYVLELWINRIERISD